MLKSTIMPKSVKNLVTAVVLAGGQSSRMHGEDKGLIRLKGLSMVEHVLNCIEPQVRSIIISANRNLDIYRHLGHPVIPDAASEPTQYHGPLKGLASAMRQTESDFLLCIPCDMPLLPNDLVIKLYQQLQDFELCMVHDGKRTQPLVSLMRCDLLDSLESYLAGGGRKVHAWIEQHRSNMAKFPNTTDFINVNSADDIAMVEKLFAERETS